MAGADAEHPGLEMERLAVGSELAAGDARPRLPESDQIAVPFPLSLENGEAVAQTDGGRPGGAAST